MRVTVFGDAMYKLEFDKSLADKTVGNIAVSFKEAIDPDDYVVVNLETPIAGEEMGFVSEQFRFNAPAEFALALKVAGTDLVMCANNHCLDRGTEGLLATATSLEAMNLPYIGIHRKPEAAYKVIEKDGVKIGFVNFTYGTNAFSNFQYLKKEENYMVDLLQRQELNNKLVRKIYNARKQPWISIKRFLKKMGILQLDVPAYERRERDCLEKKKFVQAIKDCRKDGADFVVVLPHVGGQYNTQPSQYTKEICDLALCSGADAVLANHEHVVHPAYVKNGKCVAYSLGNFFGVAGVLCDPYDKMSEYSMAVHMDFELGKQPSYSFSLYKTVQKDGYIKTVSLYDLICQTEEKDEKQKLCADNSYLVQFVMGTSGSVCLKKYYPMG